MQLVRRIYFEHVLCILNGLAVFLTRHISRPDTPRHFLLPSNHP